VARVLVARGGRVPPISSAQGGWRTEWYGHTHTLERVRAYRRKLDATGNDGRKHAAPADVQIPRSPHALENFVQHGARPSSKQVRRSPARACAQERSGNSEQERRAGGIAWLRAHLNNTQSATYKIQHTTRHVQAGVTGRFPRHALSHCRGSSTVQWAPAALPRHSDSVSAHSRQRTGKCRPTAVLPEQVQWGRAVSASE
jgi:hypothetical protein